MKKILITITLICLFTTSAFGQYYFAPKQKPMLGLQVNWAKIHDVAALWLFNEGSGDTVLDLSGNGRAGTLTGSAWAWVAGPYGSALDFPGTNEYMDSPCPPGIVQLGAMSILIRAKCNVDAAAYQGLMAIHDGANPVFIAYFYNTAGGLNWRFGTYGHPCEDIVTAIDETQWHDYLLINPGGGSTTTLYIDGISVAVGAVADLTPTNDTGKLNIGRAYPTLYGDVTVSHCMIWSRVLSSSEATELYREPFCMFEPNWNYMFYVPFLAAPAAGAPQVIFIN